jgi:hypothetical protein
MDRTIPVSKLTNDQIATAAAKIVADKAAQKAKNSIRNKAKKIFAKEILAAAAAKGLLPKVVVS